MKLSKMSPMTKAVAVALIHVLLVASVGAKLLYDRQHCPRTWFKARQFDPDLPIRGRYLSLQLEVNDPRSQEVIAAETERMLKSVRKQDVQLQFTSETKCGDLNVPRSYAQPIADVVSDKQWNCPEHLRFEAIYRPGSYELYLRDPVLYFIPDNAKDPLREHRDEQLWVLATVPKQGPPRPIALGVKKPEESVIHQLDLR